MSTFSGVASRGTLTASATSRARSMSVFANAPWPPFRRRSSAKMGCSENLAPHASTVATTAGCRTTWSADWSVDVEAVEEVGLEVGAGVTPPGERFEEEELPARWTEVGVVDPFELPLVEKGSLPPRDSFIRARKWVGFRSGQRVCTIWK
jgi:hypothetical protein